MAVMLCGVWTSSEISAQVTSTWNSTTGTWSDATRWSTDPLFPNNGNGGFNYNAVVGGGTVTLNQAITIEDLTLSGGTITGSNDLSVLGDLNWTAGQFSGSGVTTVAGGTISGSAIKEFTSRTLQIEGDVDWSAGGILRPNSSDPFGTIVVDDGATFTASGTDNRFLEADMVVNSGGRFLNTGLRWTDLEGSLTNNGTVEVAENGFMFFSGGSGSGDLIIRNNAGAIFELQQAEDYQFTGRIILDGGIFDILVFGGGLEFLLPSYLSGNGTFDAHGGTLIVDNTISPGFSIGQMEINGNLQLTSNGEMIIEATSEAVRDTIDVTGEAVLEGSLTLDITGSSIQPGDSIQILTAESITEDLNSFEVIGNDNDLYFVLSVEDIGGGLVALSTDGYHQGDFNFENGFGTDDVAAFAEALTDPRGYSDTYGVSADSKSLDGDDDLDVDDIDEFADMLNMSLAELNERIRLLSANVPEPGTMVLVMLVSLTTLCRGKPRNQESSKMRWTT